MYMSNVYVYTIKNILYYTLLFGLILGCEILYSCWLYNNIYVYIIYVHIY